MTGDMTDTQTATETAMTVVLKDEAGNTVPGLDAHPDPEELKAGDILTLGAGKDKRHWRILDVEDGAQEGGPFLVRVAEARSTLKWTLLLLGLLGVTWFLLDYLFDILFA